MLYYCLQSHVGKKKQITDQLFKLEPAVGNLYEKICTFKMHNQLFLFIQVMWISQTEAAYNCLSLIALERVLVSCRLEPLQSFGYRYTENTFMERIAGV